jgi:hypothetical protein
LVLTAEDSNAMVVATNSTAKSQVNLPAAVVGLTFTVCLYAGSTGVRIRAASGDQIRIGGVGISGSSGYAETLTLYGSITLTAVNSAAWVATSVIGTWTVGT